MPDLFARLARRALGATEGTIRPNLGSRYGGAPSDLAAGEPLQRPSAQQFQDFLANLGARDAAASPTLMDGAAPAAPTAPTAPAAGGSATGPMASSQAQTGGLGDAVEDPAGAIAAAAAQEVVDRSVVSGGVWSDRSEGVDHPGVRPVASDVGGTVPSTERAGARPAMAPTTAEHSVAKPTTTTTGAHGRPSQDVEGDGAMSRIATADDPVGAGAARPSSVTIAPDGAGASAGPAALGARRGASEEALKRSTDEPGASSDAGDAAAGRGGSPSEVVCGADRADGRASQGPVGAGAGAGATASSPGRIAGADGGQLEATDGSGAHRSGIGMVRRDHRDAVECLTPSEHGPVPVRQEQEPERKGSAGAASVQVLGALEGKAMGGNGVEVRLGRAVDLAARANVTTSSARLVRGSGTGDGGLIEGEDGPEAVGARTWASEEQPERGASGRGARERSGGRSEGEGAVVLGPEAATNPVEGGIAAGHGERAREVTSVEVESGVVPMTGAVATSADDRPRSGSSGLRPGARQTERSSDALPSMGRGREAVHHRPSRASGHAGLGPSMEGRARDGDAREGAVLSTPSVSEVIEDAEFPAQPAHPALHRERTVVHQSPVPGTDRSVGPAPRSHGAPADALGSGVPEAGAATDPVDASPAADRAPGGGPPPTALSQRSDPLGAEVVPAAAATARSGPTSRPYVVAEGRAPVNTATERGPMPLPARRGAARGGEPSPDEAAIDRPVRVVIGHIEVVERPKDGNVSNVVRAPVSLSDYLQGRGRGAT